MGSHRLEGVQALKKSNVVSIRDRLEKWCEAYSSAPDHLRIYTSNHGRTKVCIGDSIVILDLVESVRLLSQTSDRIENAADHS